MPKKLKFSSQSLRGQKVNFRFPRTAITKNIFQITLEINKRYVRKLNSLSTSRETIIRFASPHFDQWHDSRFVPEKKSNGIENQELGQEQIKRCIDTRTIRKETNCVWLA